MTLALCLLTSALLVGCAHQQAPAPANGGAQARAEEGEGEVVASVRPEAATDAAISHAVRHELRSQDCVWDNNIDIETSEAVVTLTGEVEDLGAKRCAVASAEVIRGVRGVVDLLAVAPPELEPSALVERVRTALELDAAIDAEAIDVAATAEGEVTLTGEVGSNQQRQLVEEVVSTTSGVTEVTNALELTDAEPRSDEQIAAEIEARLRNDRWIEHEPVEVEVDGREVRLSGAVASAAEQSRAYDLGWVEGVSSVDVSTLEVQPSLQPPRERSLAELGEVNDARVLEAVQDALRYDPRVASFNVTVTVGNGTVELDGMVESVAARRSAATTAMNTVGVYHVRNNLVVRPEDEGIDDEQLEQRARASLELLPALARHDLHVQATDGVLYLYGTVDTGHERAEAAEAVESLAGVHEVENRLEQRVEAEPRARLDWELEQDVEEHIFWDSRVPLGAVEVDVDDGTVTLTGEVLSWRAYQAAVDNAHEAGAEQVVSRLRLRRPPIEPLPAGPPQEVSR